MLSVVSPSHFIPLKSSRLAQRIAFVDKVGIQHCATKQAETSPAKQAVTCFTAGTMVQTADRLTPIETLRVGDSVITRDRGAQIVRWIGRTEITPTSETAPVAFAPGTLGNTKYHIVSPCHRILLSGWRCTQVAGTNEALAPALSLVNGRDVTRVVGKKVVYIHLAFDQHEVITADGVESESFHPDATTLSSLSEATRRELLDVFPQVGASSSSYGPVVRPEVKPYEARLIRP